MPKKPPLRMLQFPPDFNPLSYETECVKLIIPKGLEFRMAIRAVLSQLHKQANWMRDDDHRATKIATIFRKQIIDTLEFSEDCETMPFTCEDVLLCLQTDPSIQAFLNQFIRDNDKAELPLDPAKTSESLLTSSTPCDFDNMWGKVLAFVQTMNRYTEDFFQSIEALTNNEEIASEIVGAIPALETLPIDEVISMANNFREWIAESYLASYDVGLEQQIACDLFCIAKGECDFTLQMAMDYFYEKIGDLSVYDITDIFSVVQVAVNLLQELSAVNSDHIVYAMFLAQLGFVNTLSQAFGFDADRIFYDTRLGVDSDDWMVLCNECAWTYEHHFSSGLGLFSLPTKFGGQTVTILNSTDGRIEAVMVTDSPPSKVKGVYTDITCHPTGASTLTSIEFVYSMDWITPMEGTGTDYASKNGTNFWTLAPTSLTEGTMLTRTITGLNVALSDGDILELHIRCLRRFTSVADAGLAHIYSIKFSGTGDNPFE